LIVDDVLATGGTARAVRDLVVQLQGKIVGVAFLLELRDLNGRKGLEGLTIASVLDY
jgi:adenine phosphoribosyltransferase